MKSWKFRDNIDHIFDVIKKTASVIKSCKNTIHLEGADNYLTNMRKYLMNFESNARQKEFVSKQINEFNKMILIKRKSFNEAID